ncbi:MAG: hypothetical protein ACYC90_00760 [Candidatus Nanopelagicales bacterium]
MLINVPIALLAVFLAISVAMLLAFLSIEHRSTDPLLPLRIVLQRDRGGAFLASFFVGIGMFSMFLIISCFQAVMQYSALTGGLLFLPFSAGIVISAGIAHYLRLTAETTYVSGIPPSIIIMSLGIMIVAAIVQVTVVRTSNDDMAANVAVPAAGH